MSDSAQPPESGQVDAPASASLVGRELELDVGPIAHGGHCVARDEGRVVFVRHALPGERVRARVTKGKTKDRFVFADVMEVLRASPHRVTPPCRYAGPGRCGGCDFQHVELAEQRRLKASVVAEQLHRLAGIDVPVTVETLPTGEEDGLRWRTRLSLAVSTNGRTGLRPYHSRDVLPIRDCLIARPEVVATGALWRAYPGAKSVDVAVSSTGERAVVVAPQGLKATPTIHEEITAGQWSAGFALNARSFWQVHAGAPAAFVAAVLEGLAPGLGDRCLDLYAGVGLFARALADAVGPDGAVLVVDSDARAVAAAQRWAQGRDEVEVRAERVEDALDPLIAGGDRVDLVVLDPPRAGAGTAVIARLAALRPRAIAYVACDPAALGRDLAAAKGGGYDLAGLRAYDAFPMTHHVECVAILTPSEGPEHPAPDAEPGSGAESRP